eukprot:gene4076-biopygen12391
MCAYFATLSAAHLSIWIESEPNSDLVPQVRAPKALGLRAPCSTPGTVPPGGPRQRDLKCATRKCLPTPPSDVSILLLVFSSNYYKTAKEHLHGFVGKSSLH